MTKGTWVPKSVHVDNNVYTRCKGPNGKQQISGRTVHCMSMCDCTILWYIHLSTALANMDTLGTSK